MKLLISSKQRVLDEYQSKLEELMKKLDQVVNIHVAHRVGELTDQVEKITINDTSPNLSFQSVIPPLPTETFIGRNDYLRKMEDSFELPKTSVELKMQRRFVLYGTGGMGKTQLALKFFDENRERYGF